MTMAILSAGVWSDIGLRKIRLASMLCVPFNDLTLTVGRQEEYLAHKNPYQLSPKVFF